MIDYSSQIGEQMKELIRRWFTAKPLLQVAMSYAEAKLEESTKFGHLTIIHYRMFGGDQDSIFHVAAAVELFVLASDILDDIQDGDASDKVWMKSPAPIAIHTATSLLTLSQQAMLEATSLHDGRSSMSLASMMSKQLLQAANGQMLDLVNELNSEEDYLDMVQQKSASLLVLACMTGVMFAGRAWHPLVAEYAEQIGMAAQIKNDIRDLQRWDEKSDFLNRKKNLLTLFLVESVKEEDSWITQYFEGNLTRTDVVDRHQQFEEACKRTGANLYGSVVSRVHYNRFEELLRELEASEYWKEKLLLLLTQEIA